MGKVAGEKAAVAKRDLLGIETGFAYSFSLLITNVEI